MAFGQKTGGRTKGTPNKRTADVIAKLEALGCDPITALAKISMDEANSIELRTKVLLELASFVAPKCKAVDLSSEDEAAAESLTIEVTVIKPTMWEE